MDEAVFTRRFLSFFSWYRLESAKSALDLQKTKAFGPNRAMFERDVNGGRAGSKTGDAGDWSA